jgi:hypothetical protein
MSSSEYIIVLVKIFWPSKHNKIFDLIIRLALISFQIMYRLVLPELQRKEKDERQNELTSQEERDKSHLSYSVPRVPIIKEVNLVAVKGVGHVIY